MCNKQSNTNIKINNPSNKTSLSILFPLFSIFYFIYLVPAFATKDNLTSFTQKSIGISQIVEHPALDSVRQKMLDTLNNHGFEEGKNLKIVYDNAQGSVITSTQIANKLLHKDLDLLVGISTPSAQTLFYGAKRLAIKIPIVFTAVTDPSVAKLDPIECYPITGVTDTAHLEGLLELVNLMIPKLKVFGLMYNPAEINSVSTIQRLKKLFESREIKFIEVTVNKTQEVAQATKSLIGKVDALYLPQDNTLVSSINTIVKISNQDSVKVLPIFTNDPILIKNGILAAVGYDYEDIGIETGKVVARILKGESALNIPVHNPEQLKAVINGRLANKLGFYVPTIKLQYSKIEIIE